MVAKPAYTPKTYKDSNVQKTLCKPAKKTHVLGKSAQPVKDLTRFVRWPQYVRLQRQKVILQSRLKVPPMINQFLNPVEKNLTHEIFSLARKYIPETRIERRARFTELGKAKVEHKAITPAPMKLSVKFGLKHVTSLIESKKAKLVLIANDVDPLELVMFLPTLCHKMQVPYAIVRTKAELGKLTHRKTAACVAFTDVNSADQGAFNNILQAIAKEVDYKHIASTYGGTIRSQRSTHRENARMGK